MATETRDRRVVVMYSPSEYAALASSARAHGRSVSEHIRHRTIGTLYRHAHDLTVDAIIAQHLDRLGLEADTPIAHHALSNEYTVSQLLRRWLFVNDSLREPFRKITRGTTEYGDVIWIDRDNDTTLMIPVYP